MGAPQRLTEEAPVTGGGSPDLGDTLVTTIVARSQAAAEASLRTGVTLAHGDGQYSALWWDPSRWPIDNPLANKLSAVV